ncbi:hypothetical protein K3495_g1854 [Podosphaera aphanis]|nr:hypothetical protein K3495_g1854 [Podosphaera aphanis]
MLPLLPVSDRFYSELSSDFMKDLPAKSDPDPRYLMVITDRNDTQKDQNNIEIYPHQEDRQTTTETQQNIPESNIHEREVSNQLLIEILWQQSDPSDHQDEISDLPGAFLESPKPEGDKNKSAYKEQKPQTHCRQRNARKYS